MPKKRKQVLILSDRNGANLVDKVGYVVGTYSGDSAGVLVAIEGESVLYGYREGDYEEVG